MLHFLKTIIVFIQNKLEFKEKLSNNKYNY